MLTFPLGYVVACLLMAFFCANMIVYWAGWDTNWKLYLAIVLGLLLYGVNVLFGRERLPRLDLRSALFIVPWLGGLCLVSYLGNYPDISEHAGNLAVFGTSGLARLGCPDDPGDQHHLLCPGDRVAAAERAGGAADRGARRPPAPGHELASRARMPSLSRRAAR